MSIFGDTSFRTKHASKNAFYISLALAGLALGSVWYVGGNLQYNQVIAKSSSPIGTKLTFNRSNAELHIKNIYTDKNKNVLIAQLGSGQGASTNLPYKGTDYKVYVSSKSTDGLEEIPIIFGRMSTDGDLFFVLPNPTDKVYSIFIMNKKFITTNINNSGNKSNKIADINSDKQSISKALSSYNYKGSKQDTGTYKVEGDQNDVISFRLTLDPAFNDDNFKPKILDIALLKTEGETQTFDFEKFFETIFKEPALEELNAEYKSLKTEYDQYEDTMKEYNARLADHAQDQDAISAKSLLEAKMTTLKTEMQQLSTKINDYNLLAYSENMFNNLLTEAVVVKSK